MINRARAGHYNLAASLFRIKVINDPSCECQYEQQDLNHILWHCPLYVVQRQILLRKLSKLRENPSYNTKQILAETDPRTIKNVCKYLERCNIKV